MLFGKKKDSVSQGSAAVSSSVPGKKVERKVPQILTYSYSHMGNRQYQQDSVYLDHGYWQQIKKRGYWQLSAMVWEVWRMGEEQLRLEPI